MGNRFLAAPLGQMPTRGDRGGACGHATVGIFTAILLLCAIAGCLALVFRSLGKRGLLVAVAVLLFLFVLTPVAAW